uniref:Uncharacterized protein n=1 Tax=Candidatus Nitrotoga fabula TaxID=2182327 RepID=A0A2X0R758_9PROT|nr:protein of unknown function [Candidatus Nitrotoga fabula]
MPHPRGGIGQLWRHYWRNHERSVHAPRQKTERKPNECHPGIKFFPGLVSLQATPILAEPASQNRQYIIQLGYRSFERKTCHAQVVSRLLPDMFDYCHQSQRIYRGTLYGNIPAIDPDPGNLLDIDNWRMDHGVHFS